MNEWEEVKEKKQAAVPENFCDFPTTFEETKALTKADGGSKKLGKKGGKMIVENVVGTTLEPEVQKKPKSNPKEEKFQTWQTQVPLKSKKSEKDFTSFQQHLTKDFPSFNQVIPDEPKEKVNGY